MNNKRNAFISKNGAKSSPFILKQKIKNEERRKVKNFQTIHGKKNKSKLLTILFFSLVFAKLCLFMLAYFYLSEEDIKSVERKTGFFEKISFVFSAFCSKLFLIGQKGNVTVSELGDKKIDFYVYEEDSVEEMIHLHSETSERSFEVSQNIFGELCALNNHDMDLSNVCKVDETYVINKFPFTQGLLMTGCRTALESAGLYGGSFLREFDLRTGKTLRHVKLSDNYFGEGICLLWYYYIIEENENNNYLDEKGSKKEEEFRSGGDASSGVVWSGWNLADFNEMQNSDFSQSTEGKESENLQKNAERRSRYSRHKIRKKAMVAQVTYKEHRMLIYDYENFNLVDVFYIPSSGWGLTSNFNSNFLCKETCKNQVKKIHNNCETQNNGFDNKYHRFGYSEDLFKKNFIYKERKIDKSNEDEEELGRKSKEYDIQRIWLTTGDAYLYEIFLPPLDLSYFKSLKNKQQNNTKESNQNNSATKTLSAIKIKRKTKFKCLGSEIPFINELEFNNNSNSLFGTLFGSFLIFEFDVHTAKCKSVISLVGIYDPSKSHVDILNDVMNGIAFFPFQQNQTQKDLLLKEKFYITGKRWKFLYTLRLKKLTIEKNIVHTWNDVKKYLPSFPLNNDYAGYKETLRGA